MERGQPAGTAPPAWHQLDIVRIRNYYVEGAHERTGAISDGYTRNPGIRIGAQGTLFEYTGHVHDIPGQSVFHETFLAL